MRVAGKISPKEGSQLKSDALTQLELPIAPRCIQVRIAAEIIAAQPTKLAAIKLCIQASGLNDKTIGAALDIDSGHMARMLNGQAGFPNNKEHALMDLCGNEIPLEWDAMKRGKELKPLLSTVEQQLQAERAARLEAERQLEIIKRFVKETR